MREAMRQLSVWRTDTRYAETANNNKQVLVSLQLNSMELEGYG